MHQNNVGEPEWTKSFNRTSYRKINMNLERICDDVDRIAVRNKGVMLCTWQCDLGERFLESERLF
jgi:hypothetical protein